MADNLQELGLDIIRCGYVIYDHESQEEDWLDENIIHFMRFRQIVVGDELFNIRMLDGQVIEIELDYTYPTMMKRKKYHDEIAEKIEKRYGKAGLERWLRGGECANVG